MNRLHLCVLVCCLLFLVALPLSGQAQSSLNWSTTDGNQYLETTGSNLHIKPRTDGTGPRTVTATAKLSLPDTQTWQISFDIRFGQLKDQASSLHLLRGDRNIGWVGSDGVHKAIGIFIGKDNEIGGPAADLEWHHVSYSSDGSTLTVWLDGNQVGSGSAQDSPDTVYLDNGQDLSQPCTQTGVWVRNVQVQPQTVALHHTGFDITFTANTDLSQDWDVVSNGGHIDCTAGLLNLQGGDIAFPFLRSHHDPFLGSQDWTVTLEYRYTNSGPSGTGIGLARTNGGDLVHVHQDDNGQFIALDDNVIWRSNPNTKWHEVKVIKAGNEVTVYVDDQQIGKAEEGEQPVAFEIGNKNHPGWPSVWNGMDIDFLRVDSNTGNEIQANVQTAQQETGSIPSASKTTATKSLIKVRIKENKHHPRTIASRRIRRNNVVTASSPSQKAAPYTIKELSPLEGDISSDAIAINNLGIAVGQSVKYTDDQGTKLGHAVMWDNGGLTDLGTLPGFTASTAFSINDNGFIVGAADNFASKSDDDINTPIEHGFYWTRGQMYDLNDVAHAGIVTQANSINIENKVVGVLDQPSLPNGDLISHAFQWTSGHFVDIGSVNQFTTNAAEQINNSGWVLWSASYFNHETLPMRMVVRYFLWANGQFADFTPLSGYDSFHATSMNNRGQVVGGCVKETSEGLIAYSRACLWQNGRIFDLGTLPGSGDSSCSGINDSGTIVGISGDRPFLLHNHKIADLNTLIPQSEGWVLTDVNAINNTGQIVGAGIHFGKKRGFLMTPAY